MRKSKLKMIKSRAIQRAGLMIISIALISGCSMTPPSVTTLPAKPNLTATACQPGYICFSERDAQALGRYILDLEHAVQY